MHLRRPCRALFLGVTLSTWSTTASPQEVVPPKTYRVQVKVSADKPLKGSFQKCLENELRALPDVLLADASPDYTISVIALNVVTESSRDMGATFSVLVTAPYDSRIQRFAELHVAPEFREELISMLAGAVTTLAHWVETASAGDLHKVCRSIIQSFNRDVFTQRHRSPVPVPPK